MNNTNQSTTIKKKEEFEDGTVIVEYSNGLISLESPITYFFPEYNRHMSLQEFDYLEKKKFNEKLLEKLPPKDKEKVKKL